ncbi:GTP 3',8-cyclase MoaA [Rhodohalobacter sp.]|uniref:GTP 3',8-cyclase MoaA n=1 Tax=Rhodohalobacter sp. TaxID=1974210 RepID=UPI002ACE344B|nr:GTP 3',8-cyclase MoaA [Rhodohalobacter sp.]MDZ7756825.1 GTP 3',8-cyclase MoaA [Rhodohalobacter sp.]
MKRENELYDRFERKHDYLRVSLTEKCNLRCKYCMPADGIPLTPKAHLPNTEELLEIISIFTEMGVKKIRFTGGEPLVRNDAGYLIEEASKKVPETAITTNGILIHKYFDLFEKIGLTSLNISLDTLDPERFQFITRRDRFDKIMGNIRTAISRDFHVKINVVLLKGQNDDEIIDFIRWTEDTPVHVRFIEFMPFQGNDWDNSKLVPYFEILEKVNEEFSTEKLKDGPHDTTKSFKVKGAAGTFSVISSMTAPFCSSCNRLRLTADGKMRNCLFSTKDTDLLTPLRAGEDIRPYILNCVRDKKEGHGGLDIFDKLPNRSMIAIGG